MRAWLAAPIGLVSLFAAPSAMAGYTHYWTWRVVPDEKRLDACLTDLEKIADKSRSILADRDGKTGPDAVFRGRGPFGETSTLPDLVFNGVGDDEYETFRFPLSGTPSFSFVKTQWRTYDVAVVASLIAARDHFPATELEISSDGTWEQDWVKGAQLYELSLGRAAKNPLSAVGSPPPFPSIAPFHTPRAPDPADEQEHARRQKIGWFALAGAAVIAVVLMRARA